MNRAGADKASAVKTGRGRFLKFSGGGPLPPVPEGGAVLLAWAGGVIAISLVASLGTLVTAPMVLGSFGATCVLVFGYPDVPFSQPRNIIFGHLLSSLTGLVFLALLGPHWWTVALATGTAIALMMLTRTVHPPAGSNPVIIFLSQPGWGFLLFPTLTGALLITIVAVLYNNVTRSTNYPRYW